MALDGHGAIPADPRQDRAGAVAQAAQQRAGAAVDEALHQLLMQRVGQAILQGAGAPLPALADRRASRRDWRHRRACAPGRDAPTACRCRRRCGRGPRTALAPSPRAAFDSPASNARTSAPTSRVCSSWVLLRKSGVWQTSHRRIRLARSRQRRVTISSTDNWRKVVSSWLSSDSFNPGDGAGAASERISAASEWKSSRELRHSAAATAGKTWPSTAATQSGSISAHSPVTPKVPSLR